MNKTPKVTKKNSVLIVLMITLCICMICGTVMYITHAILSVKQIELLSVDDVVDGASDFVDEKVVGSEGQLVEIKTAPDLQNMLNINQLRTLSYQFNSVCEVQEDGETVYYVAYDSTVVLGIDPDRIAYEIDEDLKTITIVLPNVEVQSASVDPGSLEFIFVDHSYDVPSTATDAQVYCIDDLEDKVQYESVMFDLAEENTRNEVYALFKPIIDQFYSEYEFSVVYRNLEGDR